MATQILAVGTTAADSADQVVAVGATLGVGINDAAGTDVPRGAIIFIYLKDPAGQYFQIGKLNQANPSYSINTPGTYRFSRKANTVACGVFSA